MFLYSFINYGDFFRNEELKFENSYWFWNATSWEGGEVIWGEIASVFELWKMMVEMQSQLLDL